MKKKSRIEILCFYNIDENLQKILYLPDFTTIMPLKRTMNNVLKTSRIYCISTTVVLGSSTITRLKHDRKMSDVKY